ncbi:membrane hypothetical protein [Frankia sp. AiPs1]|uniref:nuclear transport factor 2 family protein n=1 Tax=Frankia sp. AiPa1 TaxID=573492 RepID=UPI00202B02F8|nr:nuclear transport factor 2 family protein [Frankia sp. AiPa1]MCL9761003.1 nuclear transport factor 2 family protein [Frankia sp. AiPa1]
MAVLSNLRKRDSTPHPCPAMPRPGDASNSERHSSTPARSRTAGRYQLIGAGALLAGALALEAAVIAQPGPLPGGPAVLYLVLGWWAVAALAVAALVRAAPRRGMLLLLVAGAVAVHVLAVTSGPRMSDDLYRYAWDGKVSSAGIDPYRYATDSPALASQRDHWLWPDPAGCARLDRRPGCTRINYSTAHTIYPPVAQAYFTAVHSLPGPPREHRLQLYAALLSLSTTLLLIRVLPRFGRHPGLAVAYAWGPSAGLDVGMDAHVDILAVLAATAALALLRRPGPAPVATTGGDPDGSHQGGFPRARPRGQRVPLAAGALLGAAVAVKLYPALLIPAAARRRAVVVLAAAGVVVLSYLPHVAVVGTAVVGFLPRYLSVEGYNEGHRFLLLGLLGLTGTAAKAVAVAVVGSVALVVWRTDPAGVPVERAALWVLGTAFLVATPAQPWYGILLVVLAILAGRLEWIAVAVGPYVLYMALFRDLAVADLYARPGGYVLGAVIVALIALARQMALLDRSPRFRSTTPSAYRTSRARRGPKDRHIVRELARESMTHDVRVAALRMYAAFNAHDHAAAEEIFTADFYSHPLGTTGPQSITRAWQRLHEMFPDAQVVIEDMVVEGDTAAVRTSVRGVPDRQPPTMLEIFRVRNGRIAELWGLSSLRRDP